MLSAAASTSRWRPTRREASTRSSSASSRSSSSRPASMTASSQSSTSSKARPRHSSSASVSTYSARSGSPRASSSSACGHHPLEAPGVDLVGRDDEPVALRGRLDGVRAQRLAQPQDATLQGLVRRGRRGLAPHGVGQLVGADHATEADGQCGRARRGHAGRRTCRRHMLSGPSTAMATLSTVERRRVHVNTCVTAEIPDAGATGHRGDTEEEPGPATPEAAQDEPTSRPSQGTMGIMSRLRLTAIDRGSACSVGHPHGRCRGCRLRSIRRVGDLPPRVQFRRGGRLWCSRPHAGARLRVGRSRAEHRTRSRPAALRQQRSAK